MLERLGEASGALREIARTTQAVSHQLDKVKAGSLEQVYDEAVDNICLRCGLKTRCWQQEYTDTLDVFHHLTPLLRHLRGGFWLSALGAVWQTGAAGTADQPGLSGVYREGGDEPQGGAGALGGDRPV